jgi:preprotein translocase subunit Sss1
VTIYNFVQIKYGANRFVMKTLRKPTGYRFSKLRWKPTMDDFIEIIRCKPFLQGKRGANKLTK